MARYLNEMWKTPIESLEGDALWEHYENCLIAHDWTFDYSDDHNVWKAGCAQRDHLNAVLEKCKEIDEDRAVKLYHTHSFWFNEDGTRKQF